MTPGDKLSHLSSPIVVKLTLENTDTQEGYVELGPVNYQGPLGQLHCHPIIIP